MAITTESFSSGNRDWLASIHGINNAKTLHCAIEGEVKASTIIPSGSPVVQHEDGKATVFAPGSTVTAKVGDTIGFTTSDRVADELGGKFVLNAATLFHGTVRKTKLSDEAKAAVEASKTAGVRFEFTVFGQ